MKVRLLALASSLLWGCAPGGDGTNTDIPIPDGAAAGCGETDPMIEAFTISDGGMRQFDAGMFPSIVFVADTSDADGDLHYYEMTVWWDLEIDGVIDQSTDPLPPIYGVVNDTECSVPRSTFSMTLGLTGGSSVTPPFDTPVEFGVVVSDDEQRETNAGVATITVYTTPKSDGTYSE